MSSGVAYGISRIIVDDLKLKKIQNKNVSCPNFKLVDSKTYDDKRSKQYKSDCNELSKLKSELSQIPLENEDERSKIMNKIRNTENKIDFIKTHKQLSCDEIDVTSFEFNSPEYIDPLVIGIKKCLEDIDKITVNIPTKKQNKQDKQDSQETQESQDKQEPSRRELNKKAKQQAFKKLVNSLGINPIENRFKLLYKTINELVNNKDLWLIKFFNRCFSHPEFENSKNQLKQYLTRIPYKFIEIIETYNGKNESTIYSK